MMVFIFIIIAELFFGYWFKEYNFGPELRGKRIQKIIHQHINGDKTFYFRDFYGMRENEDIYEKYDANKIKIVFNGGSTTDQMYSNYEDTIVGILNSSLKQDKIDLKIYNAGLSGKSLRGHIREFDTWFANIPNFKPDIMIYYIGLNDRNSINERWHDFSFQGNFFTKIYWNITQKSFFYEKIKFIKDKYFFTQVKMDRYFTDDEDLKKKLSNNEFIHYVDAKSLYKVANTKEIEIIDNYRKNLKRLKDQINKFDVKPIFITQINFNINGDKILYFLNKELKNFSKSNKYDIIKLDELVNYPLNNSFRDTIHTNEKGSREIVKAIYPELKKIFKDFYKN